MRSVSSPQPTIKVLEDTSCPHTSPCTFTVETKREPTFFLCTSSHVISLSPSPLSSIRPRLPVCLPSLAATPQSSHRESWLYESLLFFPNLSMAERLELALLQIHRPQLACLCPEKSLPIVTTDSMPTHAPHQPNKPQRLSLLWLSFDPTQPCMCLLRCRFKLFVWTTVSCVKCIWVLRGGLKRR